MRFNQRNDSEDLAQFCFVIQYTSFLLKVINATLSQTIPSEFVIVHIYMLKWTIHLHTIHTSLTAYVFFVELCNFVFFTKQENNSTKKNKRTGISNCKF